MRRASGSADENVAAWTEMCTRYFPKDEARFAFFDWSTKAEDGRNVQKLILVKWCPDTANVASKMLFGSTHEALKRALPGLARDVQAADAADVAHDAVSKAVLLGA